MKNCTCGCKCDDVFKFKPEHLVQLAKLVEFMDTTRATMDCWAEMIEHDDNFDSKALGRALQTNPGFNPRGAVVRVVSELTLAAERFGGIVSDLEQFFALVYSGKIEIGGKDE